MRRSADFFSVVLAALLLTTFVTVLMTALGLYLLGNSHSLKFLYTVETESFENYHYECRLVYFIIAD